MLFPTITIDTTGAIDTTLGEASASDRQRVTEGRAMRRRWEAYREIYVQTLAARACVEVVRQTDRVLARFTRYCRLEDLYVDQITSEHVDQYVARRRADTWRGRPLSERTINNEIDTLNTVFSKAGPRGSDRRSRRNYGFTAIPPCGDRLPVDELQPVELSDSQIAAFVSAIRRVCTPSRAVCDPRLFWDCVLLLLSTTALRRRALLGIPRPADHVLLDRLELRLPAHLDKNRSDRSWPITPRVAERLAMLPSNPGEPLLPWRKRNGRRMSASYFNEVMRTAQRAAGIDDADRVTPKRLRSTVATIVADEFGDAVAKKRLGHSPTTNTINTNYKSRKPRQRDRDASELLCQKISGLLDDRSEPDNPPQFGIVG